MEIAGNEKSLGDIVRRIRRQRNFTQTHLGGALYSKSYVSALERGKITPSIKALNYFTERLDVPDDYFVSLLEQTKLTERTTLVPEQQPFPYKNDQNLLDGEWHLLEALLEHPHRYESQKLNELPPFSVETIAAVPTTSQVGYAFLAGLSAQKKGEYDTALHAFEYALALAPAEQQPAILDAIGENYTLRYAYSTALNYHIRAYRLLSQHIFNKATSSLRLEVALHCGNDYRALGNYKLACEMYEEARKYLTAHQDMETAANLYFGLGYCMYGLVRHTSTLATPELERLKFEPMEHLYQRAIGILVQSRSIFQISGDRMGETMARLTLGQTELDLCTAQRQLTRHLAGSERKLLEARSASILEDVEEQCRQILLHSQEDLNTFYTTPEHMDNIIYNALAYLICVYTQRATLARLNGYTQTAMRERALAASLCKESLDTFFEPSFPLARLTQLLSTRVDPLTTRTPALPMLPDQQALAGKVSTNSLGLAEMYFAAAEIAEELGRTTANLDYAHDCYNQANTFYLAALTFTNEGVQRRERDPGYLIRSYQRCISNLEERATADPERGKYTIRTLLDILKNQLYQLPTILISGVGPLAE